MLSRDTFGAGDAGLGTGSGALAGGRRRGSPRGATIGHRSITSV